VFLLFGHITLTDNVAFFRTLLYLSCILGGRKHACEKIIKHENNSHFS